MYNKEDEEADVWYWREHSEKLRCGEGHPHEEVLKMYRTYLVKEELRKSYDGISLFRLLKDAGLESFATKAFDFVNRAEINSKIGAMKTLREIEESVAMRVPYGR